MSYFTQPFPLVTFVIGSHVHIFSQVDVDQLFVPEIHNETKEEPFSVKILSFNYESVIKEDDKEDFYRNVLRTHWFPLPINLSLPERFVELTEYHRTASILPSEQLNALNWITYHK